MHYTSPHSNVLEIKQITVHLSLFFKQGTSFIQANVQPAARRQAVGLTWVQFFLTLQHDYYTEMKNTILAVYSTTGLLKNQPQIGMHIRVTPTK